MKVQRMKKESKVEEKDGKRVVRAKVVNLDEEPKPKSQPKTKDKSSTKSEVPVRKPKELESKKPKSEGEEKTVVRKPRKPESVTKDAKKDKAPKKTEPTEDKDKKVKKPNGKEVSDKWRQAGLKAAETRRRNKELREAKDDKARKSVEERKPKAKVEEKPTKTKGVVKKGTLEAKASEDWDVENLSHIWADCDHGQGHLMDALQRMKALPKSMTADYPDLVAKLNDILSDLIAHNAIVREMFRKNVLNG